jgi:hypothetical protein
MVKITDYILHNPTPHIDFLCFQAILKTVETTNPGQF